MSKRDRLIEKSVAIERAANEKLSRKENTAKGDDWTDMEYGDLFARLREEANELGFAVCDSREPDEILREAGDVLNFVRFICDKAGALDLPEGYRRVT